jgi:hypothetical protein
LGGGGGLCWEGQGFELCDDPPGLLDLPGLPDLPPPLCTGPPPVFWLTAALLEVVALVVVLF